MVNLGCARNLVDSQVILGHLKRNGHHIVRVEESDVAIVNTCGFIEEAKKESIDTIIDLLELKRQGKLKKVIVAGCLAERYGDELAKEFKDIDAIVGVQQLQKDAVPDQELLTPDHFAYLKICESCYNQCSFCIIPKIKGKFVSRTIESILEEVKALDARGIKEIHIIGQDITAYGMDIDREKSLAKLLKKIVAITKNIQWIRLLYTFPAHITNELIETIAGEEKICKYIDMPLQHISDHLLKEMNRNITREQTVDLIKKIRNRIPKVSLRTAFIVGMPGESQEDFEELVEFVKETCFEKVGVFVYSREEGTPAYDMPGQIPESVKKERCNALMTVQQDISKDIQGQCVGQTLKAIIDERQEGELMRPFDLPSGLTQGEPPIGENPPRLIYLGRSEYDAPEVDGIVYVHSKKELAPGDFVMAKITDSYEYDLVGEVI